jgi:hypothetical protein
MPANQPASKAASITMTLAPVVAGLLLLASHMALAQWHLGHCRKYNPLWEVGMAVWSAMTGMDNNPSSPQARWCEQAD